jgi:hypothetical protein
MQTNISFVRSTFRGIPEGVSVNVPSFADLAVAALSLESHPEVRSRPNPDHLPPPLRLHLHLGRRLVQLLVY